MVGGFPSLGTLKDIMASFLSLPSHEGKSSIPSRFTTIDSKQQSQPIMNKTFTAKKKKMPSACGTSDVLHSGGKLKKKTNISLEQLRFLTLPHMHLKLQPLP